MEIDRSWLHDASFTALYILLGVATFVILERSFLFLWYLNRRSRAAKAVRTGGDAAIGLTGRDVFSTSVRSYANARTGDAASRERLEDLSAALYLDVDAAIQARLWVLDTVVTAAPLLGLLGTILGIMDTFNALSAGGISDPAAVSRGIASALAATAIGIGTALYGLLGHNMLHRIADNLTESFKAILLRLST